MNNLINVRPDGVRHTDSFTMFYYGIDPFALTNAPVGTEFTTVYSPSAQRGWRAIHFRVVGARTGSFQEIETRFLEPDEVSYFEGLLKPNSL